MSEKIEELKKRIVEAHTFADQMSVILDIWGMSVRKELTDEESIEILEFTIGKSAINR